MEDDEISVTITNDVEKIIADVFVTFDNVGNNTIDSREVGTVIRALGCCPTEAEVQEAILATEQPDNPGIVKLSVFMPYMYSLLVAHKYPPSSAEELLHAFRLLDEENKGFLTREEMTKMMTQEGEIFTEDELDELFTTSIDKHTDTIPYEYFINQLLYEPKDEDNMYKLTDAVELIRHPPKATKRTFSEMMAQLGGDEDAG